MRWRFCLAALVVGLGCTLPAAEIRAQEKVEGMFGAAILTGVPMGEFGNFVDTSPGISFHFLGQSGVFGLRIDGSVIWYGSETRRPRAVDITTENIVKSLFVGPQLSARGDLRPYLHGGIGFSYFETESSVSGSSDFGDFGSTVNLLDFTWAATAGGGLLIHLSESLFLDLSGRYMWNGQVRYLREGSIREAPDGSISFRPIESETNMLLIEVGVSFLFNTDEEDESATP